MPATARELHARIASNIADLKIKTLLRTVKPKRDSATAPATPGMPAALRAITMGKNVCFHGFGSKESLLRRQLGFLQARSTVAFVRGNYSEVLPRTLFVRLLEIAEKKAGIGKYAREPKEEKDAEHLAGLLAEVLDDIPRQLFAVVIFGADGPNFLRPGIMQSLARLAELPNFQVVFTIDTASFPLILSRSIADQFNFAYFALHTHRPYTRELFYIDAIVNPKHETRSRGAILAILEALTANQLELVKFVFGLLLHAPRGVLEEQELFKRALWEAKVTSFQQFVENLNEAVSHKILVKKNIDGYTNTFYTPLKRDMLEGILGIEKDYSESDGPQEEADP